MLPQEDDDLLDEDPDPQDDDLLVDEVDEPLDPHDELGRDDDEDEDDRDPQEDEEELPDVLGLLVEFPHELDCLVLPHEDEGFDCEEPADDGEENDEDPDEEEPHVLFVF